MDFPSHSSKPQLKMSSKNKKNPTTQDLFEDLKLQLKSPNASLALLVSSISKSLISKKESLQNLLKTLLNPFFKELLKISSLQDLKMLLDPFLLYCQDNPNDDSSVAAFIKLLSKAKFQTFPNCESLLFPYLKFLEIQVVAQSPKDKSPLNNNQIIELRIILSGFMNMVSKITEFKDPRSQTMLQNFYLETHRIFFKVPVDIRLQQDFFLKFLMSLFRLLGFFLEKLPDLQTDLKLLETILINLYKFMFLGTIFQKPIFGDLKDVSILFPEGNSISSSSEFSDLEALKAQENNKLDDLYSKLRNYAALALQNLIKINQKVISIHWNKLFSTSVPAKEFLDLLRTSHIFSVCDSISERKRVLFIAFKEPSLLYLLVNEKSPKVRINLSNLILQIVENLPLKQWLAGFSAEKFEKHKEKKDSFLPVSYQIFSSMRNVHLTFQTLMLLEKDCQVMSHIFKVFAMFINAACYEKFSDALKTSVFENYLFPVLMLQDDFKGFVSFHEYKFAVQANAIACVSGLLSTSAIIPKIEEKYLKNIDPTKNVLVFCFKTLEEILLKPNKDSERLLLIIECLNLFAKVQKNYHASFLFLLDPLSELEDKFKDTQQFFTKEVSIRVFLAFSRLFEEIVKASNPAKMTNEEDFDDEMIENKEKEPQNILLLPKSFLEFLFRNLSQNLLSDNLELIISSLNTFCNFQLDSFENPDKVSQSFLTILEKLLSKNASIKTAVFRTLGLLSDQKILQQNLACSIIRILVSGGQGLQNVNARIKNSWALAAWMGVSEVFKEELENKIEWKGIFEHLKNLSSDGKEKVACNGLRALGYFLKNIRKETFLKFFNETKVTQEVSLIFQTRLTDKSFKVSLNACVGLRTIFSSELKSLSSAIFSNNEIYEVLLLLLKQYSSPKSQIHALKTITLINDKEIIGKGFRKTVLLLNEMIRKLEENNAQYEDYRSQDALKSLVLELLFSRMMEDFDDSFLVETYLSNNQSSNEGIPIFDLINQLVHEIVKEQQNVETPFDEKFEEEKILTKGKNTKLVALDEIPVKGEETVTVMKIEINEKNRKELQRKLTILKQISSKMCHVIDSHEEVAISFIFYDTMKEYAELEVDGKNSVDVKVVKKGFFMVNNNSNITNPGSN